jgi:hypothetical protein
MCTSNNINKSLISLGRPDVYITLSQYRELMIKYNQVTIDSTEKSGIKFNNPNINCKVSEMFINNEKLLNLPNCITNVSVLTDTLFFTSLGFDVMDSIDINPSACNPTIVFDLNKTNILEVTNKKYNLVIDAGVMEHIFDIRNVLSNMTELVETNGYIIHIMISNNTLDHGFYQFSPTLFQDYYTANKYKIIDITLLELQRDRYALEDASWLDKWGFSRTWKYDPYVFSKNSFGQLSDAIYYTMVCVQKTSESLKDIVPQQYAWQTNATTGLPW